MVPGEIIQNALRFLGGPEVGPVAAHTNSSGFKTPVAESQRFISCAARFVHGYLVES